MSKLERDCDPNKTYSLELKGGMYIRLPDKYVAHVCSALYNAGVIVVPVKLTYVTVSVSGLYRVICGRVLSVLSAVLKGMPITVLSGPRRQ